MAWNLELEGWPEFEWNPERLRSKEQAFVENAGIAVAQCVISAGMIARSS
jgi:hypothetical protein